MKGLQLTRTKLFFWKKKYWGGRKINKALFINAQNPTKEVNWEKVMNLDKGFAQKPNWWDFNACMRREKKNYVKENGKSVLRFCCLFSIIFSNKAQSCVIAWEFVSCSFQRWNLIESCVHVRLSGTLMQTPLGGET